MEKNPYTKVKSRAPNLDKYISAEKKHNFVTYAKGARLYGLKYWTFVRLAKEADSTLPLRKTALVDLFILDAYIEKEKRECSETKGIIMASKSELEKMESTVRKGRKYMRLDEVMDYFSIGRHTAEKWAKQAGAIYKINGVKLINIEKVENFIEAFEMEVDD